MNKYLRQFFHRGLIFGGFGPIVVGIILAIISVTTNNFEISGVQILLAIVSTYILAFIQAGVSVFNQIESWSLPKSMFCHFSLLYLAYIVCYLANSWISFNVNVILIFTAIFVVIYFVVWITVYLSIKTISKKINSKLK